MRLDRNILVAKVKAKLKQSKNEEQIEKRLPQNEKEWIRMLHKDPKESLETLKFLAKSKSSTPKLLIELANSELGEVRWNVLKNKNVTRDVIMALVKNKDYKPSEKISIYDQIASHEETPREVLKILAKDKNCHEHRAKDIIRHENVSEEILKILSNHKEYRVRIEVAKHKKTPMSILKDLAEDKDRFVRMEVWENEKVPDNMAKQIADTLPPSWTGSGY